jgi:hypothetical protein
VDVEALAQGDGELIISTITALARAYTRGHGFDEDGPNEEVAAVITTAATRFTGNPKQTSMSLTAGPYVIDQRSYFTGWTLRSCSC